VNLIKLPLTAVNSGINDEHLDSITTDFFAIE
jgi:hypothetical protein